MIEIKYVIPFLTLLIGMVLGNRLAIGRDKRKEFNDMANPLFNELESQRALVLRNRFPRSANDMNELTFIPFKRLLSNKKSKQFDLAVANYLEAKGNCGEYEKGKYKLTNPELLSSAIENIQNFMPHK